MQLSYLESTVGDAALILQRILLLAAQPAPITTQGLKQGLGSVCPLLWWWHCHCFLW